MIIKLNKQIGEEELEKIKSEILKNNENVRVVVNESQNEKILGIIGENKNVDVSSIQENSNVLQICKIDEPYKLANRKVHPEDTIIDFGDGDKVGADKIMMIAGPCSVESEEQIVEIAKRVKEAGATFLRGGAFKPRTSPYSFQGLKYEGLELLKKAREATGLKIVTEIMSSDDLEVFEKDVDVIQVGARNMQNFDLLKKLGKSRKPILLKRGIASTIEEWLMSAEYIMSEGNQNVILCERGIRTYEQMTRNTLDISAVPLIKKMSHLPIIIDPSHAAGIRWMVEPLSKAAVASGCDGLIIEVHNNPEKALSDGKQSITPDMYDNIVNQHLCSICKRSDTFMKIITVCGSLKFVKEMMEITEKMELQGNCMLVPIYNPNKTSKDDFTMEEALMLDKMHKERIKLADAILVINVNNYIGNSTKSEIEFAKSLNKEIIYYTDIINNTLR